MHIKTKKAALLISLIANLPLSNAQYCDSERTEQTKISAKQCQTTGISGLLLSTGIQLSTKYSKSKISEYELRHSTTYKYSLSDLPWGYNLDAHKEALLNNALNGDKVLIEYRIEDQGQLKLLIQDEIELKTNQMNNAIEQAGIEKEGSMHQRVQQSNVKKYAEQIEYLNELLNEIDKADVNGSLAPKIVYKEFDVTRTSKDLIRKDVLEMDNNGYKIHSAKLVPARIQNSVKRMLRLSKAGAVATAVGLIFIVEEAQAGKIAKLLEENLDLAPEFIDYN